VSLFFATLDLPPEVVLNFSVQCKKHAKSRRKRFSSNGKQKEKKNENSKEKKTPGSSS
jgi:hypothetical protein